MTDQSSPMTFEYFASGQHVGQHRMPLAPVVAEWRELFPDDPGAAQGCADYAPCGAVIAAMMRGYTEILDRRLPGNVHAAQALHWGTPAPVAAELIVNLTCTEKDFRNERRWLSFHLTIDGADDARYLDADMRFLWAA